MKIFDVHAHIYPTNIASRAVESIGKFYGIEMSCDGTTKKLLEGANDFDVQKIAINSVATSAKQVQKINDYMASKKSEPKFVPLATLHPDMEKSEIIDEVARIKELGLYGLKLHPDCQGFKISGKKGRRLFETMGDFGMPILVHTGDKRHDFSHPEYMIEVAKDFPHLTFIAAHFGGWSEWEQAMKYKGLKNVMFDTSSSLAFLDSHIAKVVILGLGVEKFLYGTDFPMWSYETEIQRVLDLDLGEKNNELIFRKNAEKLFGVTID